MTDALCFFCGGIKFGALCPCGDCGAPAHPDMQLNITFSDHNMARPTLEQFGAVIQTINGSVPDTGIRFWTFMEYVSTEHPGILRLELKGDAANEIPAVLSSLTLPPVEMIPGRNGIDWNQARDNAVRTRRWWQFWRR
jgi:hypothetical protein